MKADPGDGDEEPEIPDPPPGLLKISKDAWTALFMSPQAAAIEGVQRTVAWRWVQAFDKVQRYQKTIAKVGDFVKGSQGQMVANPAISALAAERVELNKLERQLGIGLRNRADLGLTEGQAQLTAAELNAMMREADEGGDGGDEAEALDVEEAEILDGYADA